MDLLKKDGFHFSFPPAPSIILKCVFSISENIFFGYICMVIYAFCMSTTVNSMCFANKYRISVHLGAERKDNIHYLQTSTVNGVSDKTFGNCH